MERSLQYPALQVALGRLELVLDRPADAERLLRAAVAADPIQAVGNTDLALAASAQGRDGAADLAVGFATAYDPVWFAVEGTGPTVHMAAIGKELDWYAARFPEREEQLRPLRESLAAERERLRANGVRESTYIGPTTGASLNWNSPWIATGAISDGTYDTLWLTNGPAEVMMRSSLEPGFDVAACLDVTIGWNEIFPTWQDFRPVLGGDQQPIAGREGNRAFALYQYGIDDGEGGRSPFTAYFECRELVHRRSGVQVLVTSPLAAHDRQVAAVEQLLGGLRPAGVVGLGGGDASLARLPRVGEAAVAAALPGVVGSTYTGPVHGLALSWDEAWWPVAVEAEETAETVLLLNGTSALQVSVGSDYGANAIACLRGAVDELHADATLSQVAVRQDEAGRPRRGQVESSAWAEFTYTWTAEGGEPVPRIIYVWCRPLSPTAMVRVVHAAPAAAYEGEAPNREAVLRLLVLPAASESAAARSAVR
jgi:hypothetical protein